MKTKTKKAAAPKKRKPGRPRKDEAGRAEISAYIPADLLVELDRYVAGLRAKKAGASRGDVLTAALRAWRPFQRRERREDD